MHPLLEPKGELTSRLVRDLVATLKKQKLERGAISLTLRSISGVRWSALCELAAAFRTDDFGRDLRHDDAIPRLRTLFREVGIYTM